MARSEMLHRLTQSQDRRGEIAGKQVANEAGYKDGNAPTQRNGDETYAGRRSWVFAAFERVDIAATSTAPDTDDDPQKATPYVECGDVGCHVAGADVIKAGATTSCKDIPCTVKEATLQMCLSRELLEIRRDSRGPLLLKELDRGLAGDPCCVREI